jgi:hypothetical protein
MPMTSRSIDFNADDTSWGSWQDAEQSAHDAFMQRTPADRLAWLEDLLRLRSMVSTRQNGEEGCAQA